MSNLEYLRYQLSLLNFRADARFDDAYTATLERKLEYVKAQTYDKKYPDVKFRQFIPVDNSVDPGADSISYEQWSEIGMAKLISNYADDLPMVEVAAEIFTSPIRGIGIGYSYSHKDLHRSAYANTDLPTKKANSARRFTERLHDSIAAFGDAQTKLRGFLNHPNVPVLSATTDGTSAAWVGGRNQPKAPTAIIHDINDAASEIVEVSKQAHMPDTVLLPLREGNHLNNTPMSADNSVSILKFLLANNIYIKNIDMWHRLATADVAGTGPRAVVYQRDPEILEICIPQEFEQFPPQARNLAFVIPCHASTGGVKVYYPLAIRYLDGI